MKTRRIFTLFSIAILSIGNTLAQPACPSAASGLGGNSCGLSFNFSATAPTYGLGTWTLTSGPGVPSFSPNSNTPGATVTVSDYGTYTFKWTVVYGTCTNSSTITVNFYQQPVSNAGTDRTLEYLFNTNMEAEPGVHETGVWSLILGSGNISDTTKANTSVSGLALGENIFLWTVTNGTCPPSKDYITFTVNDLVIPTLITPNGDSKNEYFIIRGIETLGKTGLVIIDRRGARVYENENYDNQWNGVDYNGNPLPDDTYFFIMKTGSGKSLNGYIVIRR